MAHFRFRRSFGKVGTRRFRGARPDATPVIPGVDNYLRPDGLSLYRQPDALSLYKRPYVAPLPPTDAWDDSVVWDDLALWAD